jgi:hypothetical protein
MSASAIATVTTGRRSQRRAVSFSFREEFVGRDLSLFVTLLFDLLVDSPLVAERIDKLSVTASPEHVLHRHAHAGPSSECRLHDPVRVVNK